ncbi:MAG: hypothetical protein ACP5T9_03160 [Thermoplasmata archaeon]
MGKILCPEGREVEVRIVGGVEAYFHTDDSSPCYLFNSLSSDAIKSIILASINDDYLLSQDTFRKQILFNDVTKYFDPPIDLANYRGTLLFNAEVLAYSYTLPEMRPLIDSFLNRSNLSEYARIVLLDIFLKDLAADPINRLIKKFPDDSEYVKLYGIRYEESRIYYSIDMSYDISVIVKWFPLVYQYSPLTLGSDRLEYLYSYMKILISKSSSSNYFSDAFKNKTFLEKVKNMRERNFNMAYLYNLSENKEFRFLLDKVVNGGD